MAAKKAWKVIPAYSWKEDVLRHAKLVQDIRRIYDTKYEQSLMFPYEARAILGDFFTLPGKTPDGHRGNDILDLSPAVKAPKQASIAILFVKMEEVVESLPMGSLEQAEFDVICGWMEKCKVWKTKESHSERLYNEILSKRAKETKLVKGHMSTVDRLVRGDEASLRGGPDVQPTPGDDMREATEDIERRPPPSLGDERRRKQQAASEGFLYRSSPTATQKNSPQLYPKPHKVSYKAGEGGEPFDPVIQTVDKLKKMDADLDRMLETAVKEDESITHYISGLLTYSKILLIVFAVSSIIAGISGDGFAIMINSFPCIILGTLGIVLAVFTPRVSIMLIACVLSIITAVFFYPLYTVLRWTIYDTDPSAPLNRAVLWITVALAILLFIQAMYMTSLFSLRQRIFSRKGAIIMPQATVVDT
jgi:hypothetical protein